MGSKYTPPAIGEIYIDAKDHVLGRLASFVAKKALEGYKVFVANSEKIVVTGKRDFVLEYWKHKILERGDWYKGPFYPKRPERIFKRVVRGMLPKNWRGRIALKRVKAFIGVPEEIKDKKFEIVKEAYLPERLKNKKRKIWYVYLEEISKHVGANIWNR